MNKGKREYPIRLRSIADSRPPLEIEVQGAIIELGEPVTFITLMELDRINAIVAQTVTQ